MSFNLGLSLCSSNVLQNKIEMYTFVVFQYTQVLIELLK
jgi:hypothetical protein